MKNLYYLFLLTILSTTLLAQTTRRVNGDPDITGVNVYSTIQAAVDAANTDDVILIEPFGNPVFNRVLYGEAIVIDKKVHIRGNGYHLTNPNLSLNMLSTQHSAIQNITFTYGSNGSSLKNLEVAYLYVKDKNIVLESIYSTSSIEVDRVLNPNDETNTEYSYGNNLSIRKSYIIGGFLSKLALNNSFSATNSRINSINTSYYSNEIKNAYFKNSIIGSLPSSLSNSVFVNCIFNSTLPETVQNSSTISYSISTTQATDIISGQNNQTNVDWEDLIVSPEFLNNYSYEGENGMELSIGSLAKSNGVNGEDIGIYGGSNPYEKSGLPHHPINTFFINSGIGNDAVDINATVTIKAN